MLTALIGFAILFVIAFLGFPLGLTMLLVGFVGVGILRGWEPALETVSQQIIEVVLNTNFAVLPMFLLMGAFVYRAALSDDLYDCANAWFGHFKGGLAMATVAACGGFSAISGSSAATAATMAKVAVPSMRRFNYDDGLAAGTVAAGGTMGFLIPPSAALIVYGILTEESIADLFIAGIVPGALTVAVYMLVIVVIARIRPQHCPPGERAGWAHRWRSLYRVWAVLALFLLILGGISFGLFTPNEAGGIGAIGALVFALGRRRMTWPRVCVLPFPTRSTTLHTRTSRACCWYSRLHSPTTTGFGSTRTNSLSDNSAAVARRSSESFVATSARWARNSNCQCSSWPCLH